MELSHLGQPGGRQPVSGKPGTNQHPSALYFNAAAPARDPERGPDMGRPESRDKFHPPTFEFEEELDEKELFRRAMEGVRPLPGQPRLIRPAARRGRLEPVNPSDLMEEALQEVKEFEWPFAPGYVEGGDLQWNRRLLRRLRNGRFAVQAELDLHGYGQREAPRELRRFLEQCVGRGLTCVRIHPWTGPPLTEPDSGPQEAPSRMAGLEAERSVRRGVHVSPGCGWRRRSPLCASAQEEIGPVPAS